MSRTQMPSVEAEVKWDGQPRTWPETRRQRAAAWLLKYDDVIGPWLAFLSAPIYAIFFSWERAYMISALTLLLIISLQLGRVISRLPSSD